MKKIILTSFIALAMLTTNISANTTDSINTELDNIICTKELSNDFNKKIAGKPNWKLQAQSAYTTRNPNKSVSEDNVIASENIKIHGFTSAKPSDFYNTYKDGDLEKFVSGNYSLLTLYKDKNNTLLDSALFIKTEQSNQTDDNWEFAASGSFIFPDETLELLSNKDKLIELLNSVGIKKPTDLKVITGVYGVDGLLYFKESGREIVVPLSDGIKYETETKICSKFTPYLAVDFFNARKESDLKVQKEGEDWEKAEVKTFGTNSDINYVALKKVDIGNLYNVESESSNSSAYLFAGAVSIALAAGFIIYKKSTKKKA